VGVLFGAVALGAEHVLEVVAQAVGDAGEAARLKGTDPFIKSCYLILLVAHRSTL
jgi:hypothetical protein